MDGDGRPGRDATRSDLDGLLAAKQRALEAANRAVAVGPEVPEAYLVRALLRGLHRLEWREARADVDRAKALGADADASLGSSRLLALEGRLAEALAEAERCREQDPLNANCLMRIGYYSSAVGQLERARHAYERVLEIAPDHAYASGFLGQVLVVEGRAQEALAEAARSRGREEFRILTVALAEQALGHPAASRRARDDLVARFAHSMPFQIAEALAWSGDADRAFRWLERAAERRDLGLIFLRFSPFLASLRGDPRYPAFLRRLNLPAS
jgi:tetratricopeptide (TPR) repeat protein